MSTANHNLSDYESDKLPSASDMRFGVVVSEWNPNVTESLLEGVLQTLQNQGAAPDQIVVQYVPGSFELVYGAKFLAENAKVDAVIALGSVVRGDTPHFDYVCQGVTHGISYLNATQTVPIIFGVLTTDNMEQATDRAGGRYGNKGDEAAVTAIKMVALKRGL
ncbi:6,7-dimethyl-8-ribityllumazine synthase [Paludibacter sp.]|uniref:6,7-dimethyl-8-ribityllumazine synthase n=1 Tax=Paludibacter sp. TaxID=1898105 RepID=UPI001352B844|nr:6,7-dimethyl-8-ribityllumazine synthase [Paludibacter sp.]MTK52686.1 6,7-dimethyl-8-ribityllumazine synthase [Paludibacter sp.]